MNNRTIFGTSLQHHFSSTPAPPLPLAPKIDRRSILSMIVKDPSPGKVPSTLLMILEPTVYYDHVETNAATEYDTCNRRVSVRRLYNLVSWLYNLRTLNFIDSRVRYLLRMLVYVGCTRCKIKPSVRYLEWAIFLHYIFPL